MLESDRRQYALPSNTTAISNPEQQSVTEFGRAPDVESFHSASPNLDIEEPPSDHCNVSQQADFITNTSPHQDHSWSSSMDSSTNTYPRSVGSCSTDSKATSGIRIPRRTSSIATSRTYTRPHLITLHRESCQLFFSLDAILAPSQDITPLPSATTTRRGSYSDQAPRGSFSPKLSMPSLHFSPSITPVLSKPHPALQVCHGPPRPQFSTTFSWTSDETRRVEYDKIDRAHNGFRGFVKNVTPKCWQGNCRRNFFRGGCDGDSVRRIRLSLPKDVLDEKRKSSKWSCWRT